MNGFKEKKNISYIANALSNKNYIKSNIENIAEWITGEGIKLCRYKFFSEQEDFSKNDFLDLYNKNKLKTIKKVIEYADKLRQKYEEELNNLDIRLIIDESIPYPLMKKINMFFWNVGKSWVIQEGDKYYLTDDKQSKKEVKKGNPYFNYIEEKKNLDVFENSIKNYYYKKG